MQKINVVQALYILPWDTRPLLLSNLYTENGCEKLIYERERIELKKIVHIHKITNNRTPQIIDK